MKIALLNIAYYPNVEGGAEVSTQKLAEELAKDKDNEVFVICHGEKGKIYEVNNVKVYQVPVRISYPNKVIRGLTSHYKIQCKKDIKQVLNDIKPDVLHTNNLHEFSAITWKIAAELKIPIIHTIRDYTLENQKHWFQRKLVNNASKYVTIVTAPSEYTLNRTLKLGLFKNSIKNVSVPNAIDFSILDIQKLIDKKNKKGTDKSVSFAYLGRFSPEKGVEWLVEVFSQIDNNSDLFLFGKGSLEDNIISKINKSTKIHDKGFLNEKELQKELESIDVVIVPSLWEEPFGRIILDAYRSGCPVIATRKGGIPEVVDDNSTGILIDSNNNEHLKNSIEYFSNLENIKLFRENLIGKINEYGISIQADRFMELYIDAIKYNNKLFN